MTNEDKKPVQQSYCIVCSRSHAKGECRPVYYFKDEKNGSDPPPAHTWVVLDHAN